MPRKSMSIGYPHAGFLVNGVRLARSPQWVLTVPEHGYGTEETLAGLERCIDAVHATFSETPPVMLGSISAQSGGKLPPHMSHRTGRDADVYFYRTPGAKWYQAAKVDDIDYPRTWALLRCFITETDVDFVLIDRKVQGWLEAYAREIGEDPEWLHGIFNDAAPYHRAVVRHVPGHVAHMHVRFVSPEARRRGVAYYDVLVQSGQVRQGFRLVSHRVVRGDTLTGLGKKYKTTVRAIQVQNGLKGTGIALGKTLHIPQPDEIKGAREPVIVPPRQIPKAPPPTTRALPETTPPDET